MVLYSNFSNNNLKNSNYKQICFKTNQGIKKKRYQQKKNKYHDRKQQKKISNNI